MTPPGLDLTSILFAAAAVALTFGGGLLGLRRSFTPYLSGLGPLALSSIVFAIGCAASAAERAGLVPAIVGGTLGTLGIYAGCVLFYFSICSLLGRRPTAVMVIGVAMACYIGGIWYLAPGGHRDYGIIILALGVALIIGLTGRETWVTVRDRRQRGAGFLFAAQLLLLIALLVFAGAVALDHNGSHRLLISRWLTPLVFVAATVVVTVAMLQGLLMMGEQALRRLRQASFSEDLLTGLANRNAMLALIDKELERCGNLRKPLSLVVIEIDNIRQFNDWYGHTLGDAVLMHVGRSVRAHLRAGDHAGRWGGASFAVLLPESAGERAARLAELLTERLAREPMQVGALTLEVSVCSGLATTSSGSCSRDALIAGAEDSLAEAIRQATGVGSVRELG